VAATPVALDGFSQCEVITMIERREYIDRIKAALDVWSDELRNLEQHVIQGDPGMMEVWEEQHQELQRLLLAVQDNIASLRQASRPGHPQMMRWTHVHCDLKSLTERLYPGN
jgi:hypothetical protein